MTRLLFSVTLLLLFVFTVLSQEAPPTSKKPRDGKGQHTLAGKITTVDQAQNIITVQPRARRHRGTESGTQSVKVKVPATCVIVVDHKKGQFSDLKEGLFVLVRRAPVAVTEGEPVTAARIVASSRQAPEGESPPDKGPTTSPPVSPEGQQPPPKTGTKPPQ